MAPGLDADDESYTVPFQRVMLDGMVYFLPKYALHRPAPRAFLNGRVYEPATHALVTRLLTDRPGNIVHAGTFFGDMLPAFSRACAGTVFAFEPVLENFILAKLTVQENGLNNVILQNAGLGATPGVTHMRTTGPAGRHTGGAAHVDEAGQPAALATIDALSLEQLSILQLDVEGLELEALKGAARTLARTRPVVMIEDNSGNCAGFLEEQSYARIGKIPGLSIWRHAADRTDVSGILDSAEVRAALAV
jgi:FkbM family methyltransferase